MCGVVRVAATVPVFLVGAYRPLKRDHYYYYEYPCYGHVAHEEGGVLWRTRLGKGSENGRRTCTDGRISEGRSHCLCLINLPDELRYSVQLTQATGAETRLVDPPELTFSKMCTRDVTAEGCPLAYIQGTAHAALGSEPTPPLHLGLYDSSSWGLHVTTKKITQNKISLVRDGW